MRVRESVLRPLGQPRQELRPGARPRRQARPVPHRPCRGPGSARHARRRDGDRLGRVRPHAAHQQGRRPRPLAAGQLRHPRRWRYEDRPGDRRDQPPRRVRQPTGPSLSPRCSPHCTATLASTRPPRPSSTRPAARNTSSKRRRCASWSKTSANFENAAWDG